MVVINQVNESSYVVTVALVSLSLGIAVILLSVVLAVLFLVETPGAASREESPVSEGDPGSGVPEQAPGQYLDEQRLRPAWENVVETVVDFFAIFLWAWFYNMAARLVGGLKVGLRPCRIMHEVKRVDAAQAFKTGGVVAIFVGLIATLPSLLSESIPQVIISAVVVAIIGGLVGGIIMTLQALAYNLVARIVGGVEVNLERRPVYGQESSRFSSVEVRYVRVFSALRAGLPIALMGLVVTVVILSALGAADSLNRSAF